MYRQWVEASQLAQRGDTGDAWAVDYSGHPLLDPTFVKRPTRVGRFFRMTYERVKHDEDAYRSGISRMLDPIAAGDSYAGPERMVPYLTEADAYVNDLIGLLPEASRNHVRPAPVVTACNDFRTLLSMLFSHDDEALRFAAQRKLYLAKLLLDIDQSRHVQDGPKHKRYFEKLMREGLWQHASDTNRVEIGFEIDESRERIRYNVGARSGQQKWEFQSIFLEREAGDRRIALDVLYYNCRYKRTVTPISYELVDGSHRVIERKRWDAMTRASSGSILSKMIRKGINEPRNITDILGAMFIVHDDDAMDELLTLLDEVVANPIGWRNVTDTLDESGHGDALNPHSGAGYKVFKGDLDILYPDPDPVRPAYRFTVEVQVYTLEGFLRTVHGDHDANHLALKLRQFLHGIVPVVFPRAIYGDDWLHLGGMAGNGRSNGASA